MDSSFEWDEAKNLENQGKHGVSFEEAQYVFDDPHRVTFQDTKHSAIEERLYAIGRIKGGIVTVRFTIRNKTIRILGAGFWRKYRRLYLKEQ